MIKTVTFGEGHIGSPEDAIVFRTVDHGDRMFIVASFPFHEDMYNLMFSVPDALSIRNAIDEMTAIKMLGEPAASVTVEQLNESIKKFVLDYTLDALDKEFSLNDAFDNGARAVISRIRHIFKINQGGN